MARPFPLTAQLLTDLFLAIDQDDAVAAFAAVRALAGRIGSPAAVAVARGLLDDHHWAHTPEPIAPPVETVARKVSCA